MVGCVTFFFVFYIKREFWNALRRLLAHWLPPYRLHVTRLVSFLIHRHRFRYSFSKSRWSPPDIGQIPPESCAPLSVRRNCFSGNRQLAQWHTEWWPRSHRMWWNCMPVLLAAPSMMSRTLCPMTSMCHALIHVWSPPHHRGYQRIVWSYFRRVYLDLGYGRMIRRYCGSLFFFERNE